MSKRAIVGLLCLVACGDDDTVGGDAGEERIGPRSCDVLTIDECKADARCETIDGRSFDEDRMCVGTDQPLGCKERDLSCPPSLAYARHGSESYEFVRGCAPGGWERFAPVLPPQSSWPACTLRAGECEEHTQERCTQDKRCAAISGLRLDESRQCLGDAAFLSCVPAPLGCTAALVVARDPQGQRWWFSSGCLPAGFTSDTTEGPVNWPQCNPVPPTPLKPCNELSGDACEVDRSDCSTIKATAYDPARKCVRGQKNVGCLPKTQGCTAAITYARDTEGQAWQFSSGCQPASFTSFEPGAEAQPQSSWTQGCPN